MIKNKTAAKIIILKGEQATSRFSFYRKEKFKKRHLKRIHLLARIAKYIN